MERQRGQNQAECDDRRLLRRSLKMIDLESFNKALKSTWVKNYLDPENHGKWKYFFDSVLQLFGWPTNFGGNLKQDDL